MVSHFTAPAKSLSSASEFSDIHASVSMFSSPAFSVIQDHFSILPAPYSHFQLPPTHLFLSNINIQAVKPLSLRSLSPSAHSVHRVDIHLCSAPPQLPAPTSRTVPQKFPVCCTPWPSSLPLPWTISTCLFFSELVPTSCAPRTHIHLNYSNQPQFSKYLSNAYVIPALF